MPAQWMDDNTHANYWDCYRRNVSSLFAYSTVRVELSLTKRHIPISVLDGAIFKTIKPYINSTAEEVSGSYVCTKVSRVFAKRNMTTTVHLCREGHQGQQGALR
jgi:hypothetical protein